MEGQAAIHHYPVVRFFFQDEWEKDLNYTCCREQSAHCHGRPSLTCRTVTLKRTWPLFWHGAQPLQSHDVAVFGRRLDHGICQRRSYSTLTVDHIPIWRLSFDLVVADNIQASDAWQYIEDIGVSQVVGARISSEQRYSAGFGKICILQTR